MQGRTFRYETVANGWRTVAGVCDWSSRWLIAGDVKWRTARASRSGFTFLDLPCCVAAGWRGVEPGIKLTGVGPPSESSNAGFEAERRDGAGVPVLHLRGELDLEAEPRCRELLEPAVAEGPSVVLNIAELSFIDSTGLSLFASAHKALTARGQSLILIAPQSVPQRVLEIVGLDKELPIFETEDQGVTFAVSKRTADSADAASES